MISLTRREFDTVSTALTDAWLEARRTSPLERRGLVRQDKLQPGSKAKKPSNERVVQARPIPH